MLCVSSPGVFFEGNKVTVIRKFQIVEYITKPSDI